MADREIDLIAPERLALGGDLSFKAEAKSPTKTPPSPARSRRRKPGPSDWMWQLRHAITTVDGLSQALDLTKEEFEGARRAERAGLPIRITPYYLSLADKRDPRCPIRMQCVPRIEEAALVPGDLDDPLGEIAHEMAPGLVQRYPDRALLLATDQCAVYCRFCTRSRMVGDGAGPSPPDALEPAMRYLEAHPEVRDVIVSGGDPLTVATDRLTRLLARLRKIPSIETIRLATRAPVTIPQRITGELVRALRRFHPIWVMTHFNHPKELTREAAFSLERLADAGFPVMNQTVLLRGINDSAPVLEALFRGLVRHRARPYYLLQADPVRGTGHLRTPLASGISIMEELQGRLSGIALPKLIVDTPGGMGKVPIGPDYIVERSEGRAILRTHRAARVTYLDPP